MKRIGISVLAALGLALAVSACTHISEYSLGYATAPSTHRQAVAIEGRHAFGDEALMFEGAVRGRVGERIGQVGISAGLVSHLPRFAGRHLLLGMRGGFHGFDLGSVDSEFSFGMGTPYGLLSATWIFSPGEDLRHLDEYGITLSGGVEYDVRFTNAQPNEVVWLVTLGVTHIEFVDTRAPMMGDGHETRVRF